MKNKCSSSGNCPRKKKKNYTRIYMVYGLAVNEFEYFF